MESWYAIPSGCGAVYHSLNPRLFDKELDFIINHAEDTIIMADISFIELLERLLPKLNTVKAIIFYTDSAHMPPKSSKLYQNPRKMNVLCYEDLLEAEINGLSTFQWVECDENQACGLCYTSGTTGNPKGVLYSHRSNFLMAMSACLPDALDIKSSSCFLVCVPMFHANAWGIVFAAPFVGAKIILPGPYLDGENIQKMMELHGATHTAGVPTVWAGLMDYLESSPGAKITTLELMVVGGAQCPKHMMQYFENKWQVEVRHLWGMTELSPLGTMGTIKGTILDRYGLRKNRRNTASPSSSSSSPTSAEEELRLGYKLKQGWPLAFVDMRIVNDNNDELPWDGKQFGNLQVRGPHTLKTYFRGDPQKPATDAQGWFDTGDVATIDSEGYMAITDRAKDVIKSGGEWISSIEIENIAAGHPKVAEAAVIGISDEKWGERPLLVIVPRDNSNIGNSKSLKSELLGYLDGKIAKWWMPDDVVCVESIPHTATGKISKLQLRAQLKDYTSKGAAARSKL
jgi:acyl-CoA synthetase (AMP-forming)/AMP-acid ligase II